MSLWATEREQRSFDFYRAKTAPRLAHALDSTFWNDFILQVSHSEPAIRHALVTIGALNERLRPSTAEEIVTNGQDPNLKLALSSYNKAIKYLTKQMQQKDSDLIALLTCVLFICVEFLQDNITQALTLVHQGCAIIQAQERNSEGKNGDRISQSQQILVDHQVMPMFTRLSVLSALCGRPVVLKIPGDSEQEDSLFFIDLRGARSSLYTLMNQGHAIIRKADHSKWLEDESVELHSLRLEQSILLQQLNIWHTRFEQLQADLEMSKSLQLVHAVALLSMYYTTSSIWLMTCLEKAQECYDAYHAQFKNILEAAELIVNISEGQPQSEILFTFEMGLVPPLYFTATKCRHPSLRRQAVSLIQRAPGKEGMWDRAEMTYMASKVISMEEGGDYSAEGVQPMPTEASRLHDVQIERGDALPGQRKTVVKFISKPYGLQGPWHISKEYFDA